MGGQDRKRAGQTDGAAAGVEEKLQEKQHAKRTITEKKGLTMEVGTV